MLHIRHHSTGNVPRKLRGAHRAGMKLALYDAVEYFHDELRDRRFTKAHARAAGYWSRRPGYTKRKLREKGHDRPLEWEGKTRTLLKTQKRLSSTSKTGRVTYAGGRGFNRRHPNSPIHMREEFERILPEEAEQFADTIDQRLQKELNR